MSFVIYLLFIAINIFLAYIDAQKIAKQQVISHPFNAIVYTILALIPFISISSFSIFNFIGLFFLRNPVFNTYLNLFRDLPITYTSDTTTSVIDQYTNNLVRKIGYWWYHGTIFVIATVLVFI